MVGSLGIIATDGYPRIIPVHFASDGEVIYIHGATEGEKFELFKNKPDVTFSVFRLYASIPNYWLGGKHGCLATAFYRSAYVKGAGSLVDDPAEKAKALQCLMEKHQPDGGFIPVDHETAEYAKPMKDVAIFRIDPVFTSMKCKFAQSLTEGVKKRIIGKLLERGREADIETVHEMEHPKGRPDR
jgi:nitroimidazol reductase NimA-like FMN-containing flavoprotein (pyridoxamine 5'-phosphate oxidase superfamily)